MTLPTANTAREASHTGVSEALRIPAVPRRPLPAPSSTAGVLGPGLYPSPPPAPLLRAALFMRRLFQALADAVVPPEVAMFERAFGVMWTSILGTVTRYGVADLLVAGPLTAEEIAQRTGTNADAMHRVLRALATTGIFSLDAAGRFANNRQSKAFVGGALGRTKEWIHYCTSQSNVTAWADLDRTVETGKNAFERVFGMSVWDWFDTHPDEREMFAQAMMGLTVADAPVVASLYPFGEIKTLCDVGGGRATLLSEVLLRHPHLRGILCDVQGVLDSARPVLAARGVADRVELRAGSFFESVPPGADAYLMKNILHDWDDARSKVILSTVRRAMQVGQRLIVVETIAPRNAASGIGPMVDVQMMVVCSDGRERSVEEFHALLRATGFEPGRLFSYPTVSVIEGHAA